MGWLQLGWVGSIVFFLYYLQQIKMTLKDKGHEVSLVTGWISDFRKFKQLANSEPDEKSKGQYVAILNGLYLSLLGLGAISLLLLKAK
jgi:hypothetical protein